MLVGNWLVIHTALHHVCQLMALPRIGLRTTKLREIAFLRPKNLVLLKPVLRTKDLETDDVHMIKTCPESSEDENK